MNFPSRIVIFGNSGAGKTHLARALASALQVPAIDLDRLFWQPGGFGEKRPETEVQSELQAKAAEPAWIIEGVFGELAQRVLDGADLLIWLDLDRETCLASIVERGFNVDDETKRPEIEASFGRLLRWAEDYWTREGPRSHTGHLAIYERFPRTKRRLRSRAEVDAFAATIAVDSPITGSAADDQDRIKQYYARAPQREWERLDTSDGEIEFALTRRLIASQLRPGSRVLDLGGGPGRYAFWMADAGHHVTLADLSPDLIDLADRRNGEPSREGRRINLAAADARDLGRWADGSFDAVLALGPLYHLPNEQDREAVVREISRVLVPGGLVFASFLSRWSFLRRVLASHDERPLLHDTQWLTGLIDHGRFRNPVEGRFPVGYGARPEEIPGFFDRLGFEKLGLFAVESFAGGIDHGLADLAQTAPEKYEQIMDLLLRIAVEPSIHGFYGHVLFVGRKRPSSHE